MMKRNNGYMYPPNKCTAKKLYRCATCGKTLLPKEAYCYVDANNYAITNSASAYCRDCYIAKYGE